MDLIKTTVGVLKSVLNLQMGYDVTKPINLTSNLEDLNKKFGADLYASTTFDANKKIESQILIKGMQLQTLYVKASKMGYYPTLVAFVSYQLSRQIKTCEFPNYNSTPPLGLQLNVPVFHRLAKHARLTQPKLSLHQMYWSHEKQE